MAAADLDVACSRVTCERSRIHAVCCARGIAFTGVAAKPEELKSVVESGAQFILYGTDLILMRRDAERAAQALAPFRKRAAGSKSRVRDFGAFASSACSNDGQCRGHP